MSTPKYRLNKTKFLAEMQRRGWIFNPTYGWVVPPTGHKEQDWVECIEAAIEEQDEASAH